MAVESQPLANGKAVHWVRVWHLGERINKKAPSRREADRLNIRLKKEIEEGRFNPDRPNALVKVSVFFARVLLERKGRAAKLEKRQLEIHVLNQEWFTSMRVADVTPPDIRKLIVGLRESGQLAESTITNIHSVMTSVFQEAVFLGVREVNPCKGLPNGVIIRGKKKKRQPYERAEVRKILSCEAASQVARVFLYLAFYTGMREGEVCGRTWADWMAEGEPLGALHVHTQYNHEPLKTDDNDMARPRWVPVHPELQKVLQYWWDSGWKLVFGREPLPEDFIVPTSSLRNLARSSAYKIFRTAIKRAGVDNKSLHSTRHTFITVARAGTKRADMVERITHNSAGTTLDQYTHEEWETLCEIVKGVDYSIDRSTTAGFLRGGPPRRSAAPVANPLPVAFTYGHSTEVTYKGETRTVSQWGVIQKLPPKQIAFRLNNGWDLEKAMTTPLDPRRQRRLPGVLPVASKNLE